MPFSKDPGKRDHPNFCSYCHRNGELVYQGDDVNEFKRMSYQSMRENGMGKLQAKFFTWMIGFAPYWKSKQKR